MNEVHGGSDGDVVAADHEVTDDTSNPPLKTRRTVRRTPLDELPPVPVIASNDFAGPMFRRPQAAKYIGISPGTLAEWDRLGTGPPRVRLGSSRAVGYLRADLDQFLLSRRIAS